MTIPFYASHVSRLNNNLYCSGMNSVMYGFMNFLFILAWLNKGDIFFLSPKIHLSLSLYNQPCLSSKSTSKLDLPPFKFYSFWGSLGTSGLSKSETDAVNGLNILENLIFHVSVRNYHLWGTGLMLGCFVHPFLSNSKTDHRNRYGNYFSLFYLKQKLK